QGTPPVPGMGRGGWRKKIIFIFWARPEAGDAGAPGVVVGAEAGAQELFLGRDDGAVLQPEESDDERKQERIVGDQAEAQSDAKVAQVKGASRQFIRA